MSDNSAGTSLMEVALDRLRSRQAIVGVFGLGYVGLPLALTFARAGFRTIGFDIDRVKTERLAKGECYFQHLPADDLGSLVEAGRIQPTTDFARTSECDALIVCVPTPLDEYRAPDLSYVETTTHEIARHLRPGQLYCLESTTYPGTTKEVVVPILTATGREVGVDLFVAYSPEREDPGNARYNTQTIPKLVSGETPSCLAVARLLYESAFDEIVPVDSCAVAEGAKILENVYRAVNIALVNELKVLFSRMGIDVWDVIRAASSKPFGFTAFQPGPGLGGHCIPIDPFYLTWLARRHEMPTRFIELAGEINSAMPEYVVGRVAEALNHRLGKALSRSKVLVLGAAYKKNIEDVRESPAIVLIEKLLERGAEVVYNDPFVSELPPMRHHQLDMRSEPLTDDLLRGVDCVLIATDHDQYDYQSIGRQAGLIVDTRNAMARYPEWASKVCKA